MGKPGPPLVGGPCWTPATRPPPPRTASWFKKGNTAMLTTRCRSVHHTGAIILWWNLEKLLKTLER